MKAFLNFFPQFLFIFFSVSNFSNSPNLVTLDLKNNKLSVLTDEIFVLQNLKLLDISNNDFQSLPPELGIMKNLSRIQVEGNPLRSIRMGIRTGGTNKLKKYLATKIDPNAVRKAPAGDDSEFSKIKQDMVKEEFLGGKNQKDVWATLIREFKEANGTLILRNKDLKEITEGILTAGSISRLDISDNKIAELPPYLYKLDPAVFKMSNNLLREIPASFHLFRNLREIELQGNKISSFMDNLSPSECRALHENFIGVYHLDLSQNLLTQPPECLYLFQNLRMLTLSYNRITQIEDLFRKEGELETLEIVDFGNNKIWEIPRQIYKWQRVHSLNFENNDIK